MLVSRTRFLKGVTVTTIKKCMVKSAGGAFHHARTCGGETKKLIAVKLAVLTA